MRTEPQASEDTVQLLDLIGDISVAMLTNMDAYGALTSRPMLPLLMDAQAVLWFYADARSTKIEHLQVVNLAFVAPSRGVYVSLSGRGELDTDRTRVAGLWVAAAKPWFPDGPDSQHLVLLKVLPDAAEYWDEPQGRMNRMFAYAASMVAGRPLGMGEHVTLPDLSHDRAATRSVRQRRMRSAIDERSEPTI